MTEQELNTIIQSGEGYKIEFKRSVNSDLSKELVAFSNSSGGRIFIGFGTRREPSSCGASLIAPVQAESGFVLALRGIGFNTP